jgi:hypothetical protein
VTFTDINPAQIVVPQMLSKLDIAVSKKIRKSKAGWLPGVCAAFFVAILRMFCKRCDERWSGLTETTSLQSVLGAYRSHKVQVEDTALFPTI